MSMIIDEPKIITSKSSFSGDSIEQLRTILTSLSRNIDNHYDVKLFRYSIDADMYELDIDQFDNHMPHQVPTGSMRINLEIDLKHKEGE